MTEDWELCFLPLHMPHAIKPPGTTPCGFCGKVVHHSKAVVKQFHSGHMTDVKHYCSDDCHHRDYIRRLNQWGM